MTKLVVKNESEKVVKKGLTDNQVFISKLLIDYYDKNNKSCNSYELINSYKQELQDKKIRIDKCNSVNATLASLVSKGYVSTERNDYDKDLQNNKVEVRKLTCYIPNDNLYTELQIEKQQETTNNEENN